MFRAETARCHHGAKGEFDLSARKPLYGHRYPDLCSDCANLLIVDIHREFWVDRHARNQRVLDECKAAGESAAAAVAEERMRTSASVLRRLDAAQARTREIDDAA